MGTVARLCLFAVLALLPHAGAAYGASANSSPGDPPAGSPSAAVYQLPFEKGRADAAPKGSGGTSAEEGGAAGGGSTGGSGSGGSGSAEESEGSFYRSENNFGSSSQVPGVPGNGSAAIGISGSGSGGAGGDSGGAGDGNSGGALPGIQSGADTGNTSVGANVALLILIVLVAAGVGYFSLRANRLKAQQ